jgi:hypothetical protein
MEELVLAIGNSSTGPVSYVRYVHFQQRFGGCGPGSARYVGAPTDPVTRGVEIRSPEAVGTVALPTSQVTSTARIAPVSVQGGD